MFADHSDDWIRAGFHIIKNCHTEFNDRHGIKVGGKGNWIENCVSNDNNPNGFLTNPDGTPWKDGNGLQISDRNWETTVIGGEFYNNFIEGICIRSQSSSSISDINSYGNGRNGINICGQASNITVSNANLYENTADGIMVAKNASFIEISNSLSFSNELRGIRICDATSNITIKNCKIHSNDYQGISISESDENTPQNVLISYNEIYNNSGSSGVGGINATEVAGLKIYNNVLYGNQTAERSNFDVHLKETTSNVELKNNILNNLWVKNANSLFESDHNCYYGDPSVIRLYWEDYTLDDWQKLNRFDKVSTASDPHFVDSHISDFHLQDSSPCIDAGTYVGLPEDFDGTSVPIGSAPDIGAYEFEDCPEDPDKIFPGICGCGTPDIDSDEDGYYACIDDCNDNDPDINPGATEVCDGKNNNCDGIVDEGCCEEYSTSNWEHYSIGRADWFRGSGFYTRGSEGYLGRSWIATTTVHNILPDQGIFYLGSCD